jgi:hypothetical protein
MKTKYVEKIRILSDLDFDHSHGTVFEVYPIDIELKVKLKGERTYRSCSADFDSQSDIDVYDSSFDLAVKREIEYILKEEFHDKLGDFLMKKLSNDVLKTEIKCD